MIERLRGMERVIRRVQYPEVDWVSVAIRIGRHFKIGREALKL
jgi:hypothetical protein